MDERFERMMEQIFRNEGVYSNIIQDVGGKTLYGVSKRFWKKWYLAIEKLYLEENIASAMELAKEFYYTNFWNHLYSQLDDESLCFKLFDFSINTSTYVSVKLLQSASNQIADNTLLEDGIFGRKTLNSVNFLTRIYNQKKASQDDETYLYDLYVSKLDKYYKTRKTFWKFGKGWLNRLSLIYNESKDINGKINVKILIHKNVLRTQK